MSRLIINDGEPIGKAALARARHLAEMLLPADTPYHVNTVVREENGKTVFDLYMGKGWHRPPNMQGLGTFLETFYP